LTRNSYPYEFVEPPWRRVEPQKTSGTLTDPHTASQPVLATNGKLGGPILALVSELDPYSRAGAPQATPANAGSPAHPLPDLTE